ncbi:hypothetical protein D3C87_1776180 [compost metagenome]
MAGARVRNGGAGALGLDAEHAILQALAGRVIDQRDLALRVGDQLAVVIPAGHPELCVGVVARKPCVPLFVIQQPCLAVQEGLDGGHVDRFVEGDVCVAHAALPAASVASFAASADCSATAFFITSSQ